MNTPTLTIKADNKKTGLTLAELAQFVSWAYANGATDTTRLTVRVGFTSQIQAISTREETTA